MYACMFDLNDSLNILMFHHCQQNNINDNDINAINFQNKFGESAIYTAARYNCLKCMQILLEYSHTNVNLQTFDVK